MDDNRETGEREKKSYANVFKHFQKLEDANNGEHEKEEDNGGFFKRFKTSFKPAAKTKKKPVKDRVRFLNDDDLIEVIEYDPHEKLDMNCHFHIPEKHTMDDNEDDGNIQVDGQTNSLCSCIIV